MRNQKRFLSLRVSVLMLALVLFCNACAILPFTPAKETQPDWDTLAIEDPQPSNSMRYYYQQLSTREKHAYNRILAEIEAFPERIEIPVLSYVQLNNVFEALSYDNPRLMMFGTSCSMKQIGGKTYFQCDYRYPKAEYERKVAAVDAAVEEILSNMDRAGTTWEQELYLHDSLLARCEYQAGSIDESTPYGSLVEQKATCEGYARAMKLLLDQAGITCYVIGGQSKNRQNKLESHLWNIVEIDGEYYHLDPTWNDPVGQKENQGQHYLFFNLSDKEISNTHRDFQSINKCTATAANYYVKTGLSFSEYNGDTRTAITEAFIEQLENDRTTLDIRFTSKQAYDQALNGLLQHQQLYRIFDTINLSITNKINTNSAKYIKNDDLYALSFFVQWKA